MRGGWKSPAASPPPRCSGRAGGGVGLLGPGGGGAGGRPGAGGVESSGCSRAPGGGADVSGLPRRFFGSPQTGCTGSCRGLSDPALTSNPARSWAVHRDLGVEAPSAAAATGHRGLSGRVPRGAPKGADVARLLILATGPGQPLRPVVVEAVRGLCRGMPPAARCPGWSARAVDPPGVRGRGGSPPWWRARSCMPGDARKGASGWVPRTGAASSKSAGGVHRPGVRGGPEAARRVGVELGSSRGGGVGGGQAAVGGGPARRGVGAASLPRPPLPPFVDSSSVMRERAPAPNSAARRRRLAGATARPWYNPRGGRPPRDHAVFRGAPDRGRPRPKCLPVRLSMVPGRPRSPAAVGRGRADPPTVVTGAGAATTAGRGAGVLRAAPAAGVIRCMPRNAKAVVGARPARPRGAEPRAARVLHAGRGVRGPGRAGGEKERRCGGHAAGRDRPVAPRGGGRRAPARGAAAGGAAPDARLSRCPPGTCPTRRWKTMSPVLGSAGEAGAGSGKGPTSGRLGAGGGAQVAGTGAPRAGPAPSPEHTVSNTRGAAASGSNVCPRARPRRGPTCLKPGPIAPDRSRAPGRPYARCRR